MKLECLSLRKMVLLAMALILAVGIVHHRTYLAAPDGIDLAARLSAPSAEHWLGTDPLGRDLFARLIHGAGITLLLAGVSVILSGALGSAVGLIAGYMGGLPDRILMRLTDMQMSFPTLLLALLIVATLGPSFGTIMLTLALTGWTRFARIVRGQAFSLKERDFILSARSIGAGHARIMLVHILPGLSGPLTVIATLELARVILMEAALGYLGLGIQPPTASWGRILAEGEIYIGVAWWVVAFPGVAIILTVLTINLAGDWLRDRLAARN